RHPRRGRAVLAARVVEGDMISTLAVIGGIGTTGALVAVIVLAFKLARRSDSLLDVTRSLDTAKGQLALEEQRSAALATQLKTEQDLRSVVEARLVLAQRRVTELLKSHLE